MVISRLGMGAKPAREVNGGSIRTEERPASLRWLLEYGVAGKFEAYGALEAWWGVFRQTRCQWPDAIDQALVGGMIADRLAFAFAAGYQAALRALVPSVPQDRLVSFSVTEEGGAHPRAVNSTLRATVATTGETVWRLSGRKRWTTLSCEAGVALIVASTGREENGRNQLRVAEVSLAAPGVTLRPMPPTAFTPEIGHAEIILNDVALPAAALLPGDGYADYVKPFRTVEDIHVTAAVIGHLLGIALRFRWPSTVREDLTFLAGGVRALAFGDPKGFQTHVGLSGLFRAVQAVLEACEPLWSLAAPEVEARWRRDVALLQVASGTRSRRTDAAWRSAWAGSGGPGEPEGSGT